MRQLGLRPDEALLRDLFAAAAAAGGEGEETLDLAAWGRFVGLLRAQPAEALTPAPEKSGFLGLR